MNAGNLAHEIPIIIGFQKKSLNAMLVDKSRLAEWVSRLVQIPSVTPNEAGSREEISGEARLAKELVRWFEEFGGDIYTEEVYPERPNVYAIWRGETDRWLAVDVHMDTVGIEQMKHDPFSGLIQNNRVHGRGSVDTKATLGIMLSILESLKETGNKLKPSLMIAATADEEIAAGGGLKFSEWVKKAGIKIDQLLVAEPTLCTPVYGHKGNLDLEFQVKGKSAHSSQPELGQNAITAAAHLILGLEEEQQRLVSKTAETELGTPRLTVSLIKGGRGIATVPDNCTVSINRRVVIGEQLSEIRSELLRLAQRKCPLPLSMKVLIEAEPFYQSPHSPWLLNLAEWSGNKPDVIPYATNASLYGGLANECVVLGPGSIEQAHSDEEWVEISQLEKIAGIYCKWWEISS